MKKIVILIISLLTFTITFAQENKLTLVVGTYTNKCDSKGIYVYDFDAKTGDFTFKNVSETTTSPSYLTISKNKDYLYTVNENGKESTISAFSFNKVSGEMQFINKQDSNGASPCYIINNDKNVITANYTGGNLVVFPKNPDGSLAPSKQVVQHVGKSINEKRQTSPHAHMVSFSPDKKYVFANDLGTDKVYSYQYDQDNVTETLKLKDTMNVKPGSGPRHSVFSNNGDYLYLLQELDGAITVFSHKEGYLKKIQETSVVDKKFTGDIGAADIHISPDGKFLYATNRGTANTISIFKILKDGKLSLVEHTSTLGKKPRNFTIDPTGNFLLIGHQDSSDIIIFRRNKTNGKLTPTSKKIEVCAPVCLVFI
jgi:6-phosphogluconolactonase